jgi:hypothetical protein
LALLTFDLCATALFVARRTPWGRIVAALATEDLRGPAVAAVLGTPRRTSPPAAALANGTLAMGFEYEDTHPLGGHPFSIAFPAALAVGQWRHLPASEVLTAAAAGYEVEIRLRRAARMTSPWPDRGLYPVTLFGVFGAAAAAGRAAGLSPAQMVQALGIAGSHAFGTMQAHAEGTMTRRLHGGKAAEVGVLAALLARMTRTSLLEVLQQDYVRTARSKGLPGRIVLGRHALRPALIPVVTVVGLGIGHLLTGSIVVETVFVRPGLGTLLVEAIRSRDYPVVQGTLLFFGLGIVVLNIVVDLVYTALDPRVRYG